MTVLYNTFLGSDSRGSFIGCVTLTHRIFTGFPCLTSKSAKEQIMDFIVHIMFKYKCTYKLRPYIRA